MSGQLNLFTAGLVAESVATSTATFSPCGLFRYTLGRTWDPALCRLMFLMLNPSTATAETNDATVRRCIGYAKAWAFGGLDVCNLFAFRSTFPTDLRTCADIHGVSPVGGDNDAAIIDTARKASKIICGWGVHGALFGRGQAVCDLLGAHGFEAWSLGCTAGGHPKHPLYLKSDAQPTIFIARA